MQLTEDLKAYRFKNIYKRILLCFIILSVMTVLIYHYREAIFSFELIPPFAVVCMGIAVYTIPFAVSGIPLKLIDSDWEGEVIYIDIVTSMGTDSDGRHPNHYTKNDIVLTIKKKNGKIIKHSAKTLGIKEHPAVTPKAMGKIENHIGEFSVGDKVYHFYGFDYNFYVRSPENKHAHCIVCGTANNIQSKTCWNCKNELLKPHLKYGGK